MSTETRTLILNSRQVNQRLNRLAWQVYEQCSDEKEIVVAGIAANGFRLAGKIAAILRSISPLQVQLAEMKINKDQPLEAPSVSGIDEKKLEGKAIVLIDDVSNSGRTLMYGVRYFLAFPVKSIHTLVLVDRDHNRFPVKTNFVGLSLATTMMEHISVEQNEKGEDVVYLD
jgi:pyrimidine operon attenuation protein/uracil phosphoribosyltransferase